MNVELLRQIVAKAKAMPETFSMAHWGMVVSKDKEHPCGAVGCIAGTAILLSKPATFQRLAGYEWTSAIEWQETGAKALGISHLQAARLFYIAYWPKKYRDKYQSAKTKADRIQALSSRVEHFIKTEGRK